MNKFGINPVSDSLIPAITANVPGASEKTARKPSRGGVRERSSALSAVRPEKVCVVEGRLREQSIAAPLSLAPNLHPLLSSTPSFVAPFFSAPLLRGYTLEKERNNRVVYGPG